MHLFIHNLLLCYALWMVKDCMISHYNQLVQGENSRGTRFQNGCLLFSQYYTGSDKQNKRIYNSEEHRKFYKVWHNKSKERREGFADRIE